MGSGQAGKWGGTGRAYEHDVLDIVEGHSSWWMRLVFGMNMVYIQWLGYMKPNLGLSSIERYVR